MILPLCIVFGRRPVLLGCCLLLLGSTIGAAKSNSYQTHMACRILQGIATGATESVSGFARNIGVDLTQTLSFRSFHWQLPISLSWTSEVFFMDSTGVHRTALMRSSLSRSATWLPIWAGGKEILKRIRSVVLRKFAGGSTGF
jgi:MFS family permease